MNEELNIIVLKLADIGKELNRKFGTDSYELRCALFDIREELSKLSQHDVIKNEVAVCPVCDGRGSGNFGGEAFTEECDSCEGTGKTVL